MPISTKRLTEIRFMISDLLQRHAWEELYTDCGTNDLELARSIANIFAMFDPAHVWKLVDYVARLPADRRREKRDSTVVVCLTIGKIGDSNPSKALHSLRLFLSDDHMLRQPVEASLSNIWIFDRRTTEKVLFESWVLNSQGNDDLQEIAVLSSAYLLDKEPEAIQPFLIKVMKLKDSDCNAAKNAAKNLAEQYDVLRKISFRIGDEMEKNRTKKTRPRPALLKKRKRTVGRKKNANHHPSRRMKK
jgi:hypothetical protein